MPKKTASNAAMAAANANAKKIIKSRLDMKTKLLKRIDNKLNKKKVTTDSLDKLKSLLNGEATNSFFESLQANKKNKGIGMNELKIKELTKLVEEIKAQKNSEIEELQRLKVSIDKFVNDTLQDMREIKFQSDAISSKEKKGKDSKQDRNDPSQETKLSVSLFELTHPNAVVKEVYKKKKKQGVF